MVIFQEAYVLFQDSCLLTIYRSNQKVLGIITSILGGSPIEHELPSLTLTESSPSFQMTHVLLFSINFVKNAFKKILA